MAKYILKRLLYFIPMLFVISILIFITIQLPPGDFVTRLTARMRQLAPGATLSVEFEQGMRERYGLNEPLPTQYIKWIGNILLRGDFGYSLENQEPAERVIMDRMPLTLLVSISSLFLSWLIALPIGVFSAVRQYTIADYFFSFIGFIGMAIPNFLIALVLMYAAFKTGGISLTGLFSPEFEKAPWNLAKFLDLLNHMWIPAIIIAVSSTAGLIRTMRANLLDELHKPYVETARAKGLPEWKVLLKYPFRHALNPFVSGLGWVFTALISGEAIVAIVLNLPTISPVMLNAQKEEDLFVSAGFLMLLSFATLMGMLVSDILLAWLDPRIRYES